MRANTSGNRKGYKRSPDKVVPDGLGGIKFYPQAVRCPECGTMNYKRDEQDNCQPCVMKRLKKK